MRARNGILDQNDLEDKCYNVCSEVVENTTTTILMMYNREFLDICVYNTQILVNESFLYRLSILLTIFVKIKLWNSLKVILRGKEIGRSRTM